MHLIVLSCFQCELFAADLIDTGLQCEEYADDGDLPRMDMPSMMTEQETNETVSEDHTGHFVIHIELFTSCNSQGVRSCGIDIV